MTPKCSVQLAPRIQAPPIRETKMRHKQHKQQNVRTVTHKNKAQEKKALAQNYNKRTAHKTHDNKDMQKRHKC